MEVTSTLTSITQLLVASALTTRVEVVEVKTREGEKKKDEVSFLLVV